MEKYNENAHCPKCGSDLVGTRFVRSTGMDIELTGLFRDCSRCGYEWQEKALDEE